MKVLIDLDPRDVWRIQEQAERLGVTPGEIVRAEMNTRRAGLALRDAVRERVKAGMCDADVAAELHCSPGWIATVRRGLGLPANRRYPRRDA